jgi:hypothetical protein
VQRLEAVIGEDQQDFVGAHPRARLPHQSVHLFVHLLQHRLVLGSAEHMLDAIGAVKHGHQAALRSPLEQVPELLFALLMDTLSVGQKLLVVQHIVLACAGIFCQSAGREGAAQLAERHREEWRPGERGGRSSRVDLDRSHIQGALVDSQKLNQPASRAEGELYPGGPLALRKREAPPAHFQFAVAQPEEETALVGALDLASQACRLGPQLTELAVLQRPGLRGKEGVGALRAQQIRRPHGGQQKPWERLGRPADGYPQHMGEHARLAQQLPEAGAAP